jgi:hypothetical protein
MYQLMTRGTHPLYNKEKDTYYDYLQKLRSIAREESQHLNWKLPSDFSE